MQNNMFQFRCITNLHYLEMISHPFPISCHHKH